MSSLATVRGRTTLLATLIVAIMLGLSSLLLVGLLYRSLIDNIDQEARSQASKIASLVSRGSFSQISESGDALFLVVGSNDQVIAASPVFQDTIPFSSLQPIDDKPVDATIEDVPLGPEDTFRVTAMRSDTPTGRMTIYVASRMEPIEETIAILQGALAIGSPVLLVMVAFTAWLVVGRALHPVEAIRTAVDKISDQSLQARVPVPSPHDEINRLATTMNKMLERLQSSSERQRRFIEDASHELQTPLASARANLEVALTHPGDTDWTATAGGLLEANTRMENLVRDLLYLARTDAQAPTRSMVRLNLDDIIFEEVARMRPSTNVTIDTKHVSGAEVRGRRTDLERAVRNLLDNASMHATSRIDIELVSDDATITLVVSDDGPGIPAGSREQIFDRFIRLDESRVRDVGGTGLGLAIVKEIVESHGGTIMAEDSEEGARFVLRLPAPYGVDS